MVALGIPLGLSLRDRIDAEVRDQAPSEANGWHWEGFGLEHVAAFEARRRMLAGDHTGIDLVERLRFCAERGWYTKVAVLEAILAEAADEIERLRGA